MTTVAQDDSEFVTASVTARPAAAGGSGYSKSGSMWDWLLESFWSSAFDGPERTKQKRPAGIFQAGRFETRWNLAFLNYGPGFNTGLLVSLSQVTVGSLDAWKMESVV